MQWTWTWANFGRWWGTGKPDVLQPMGSQRVRHNWVTEQQQQPWLYGLPQGLGGKESTCNAEKQSIYNVVITFKLCWTPPIQKFVINTLIQDSNDTSVFWDDIQWISNPIAGFLDVSLGRESAYHKFYNPNRISTNNIWKLLADFFNFTYHLLKILAPL